jgi:phosphatidylethanolamine/phosphatidyl-N-methylethanolamine N-methyltransferase
LDIDGVRDAYRRYAHLYDRWFGKIFHPGRKLAIDQMGIKPGDRVLEVGVGTGLSLPEYPEGVEVTGIDVSPEMINQARQRAEDAGMTGVTLAEMDAEAMDLPDRAFDHVVAMYVLSVSPHPRRVVNEMRRVCKPGGDLFIVNHFRHANPVISTFERLLAPLSGLFGFHPDFAYDDFIEQTDLQVIETHPVNLFGYWTLVRAASTPQSAATAAAA